MVWVLVVVEVILLLRAFIMSGRSFGFGFSFDCIIVAGINDARTWF